MQEEQCAEELFVHLAHIGTALSRVYKGAPLYRGEFLLLHVIDGMTRGPLCHNSFCSATLLSEELRVSKPAVSKLLNTLESKGYVERKANPEDRRSIQVALTEQGRKCLEEEHKAIQEMVCKVVRRLGRADTETFLALSKRVYRIIEEEIDQIPAGQPEKQEGMLPC